MSTPGSFPRHPLRDEWMQGEEVDPVVLYHRGTEMLNRLAAALPRMARGITSVTTTVANTPAGKVIALPGGWFANPPVVVVSAVGGNPEQYSIGTFSITTGQFTLFLSTPAPATVNLDWIAVL